MNRHLIEVGESQRRPQADRTVGIFFRHKSPPQGSNFAIRVIGRVVYSPRRLVIPKQFAILPKLFNSPEQLIFFLRFRHDSPCQLGWLRPLERRTSSATDGRVEILSLRIGSLLSVRLQQRRQLRDVGGHSPGLCTSEPEMSGRGKLTRLQAVTIGQGLPFSIVDAESARYLNDGPGGRHLSWLGHGLERKPPTKVPPARGGKLATNMCRSQWSRTATMIPRI